MLKEICIEIPLMKHLSTTIEASSRRTRRTESTRLLIAVQSVDQEKPPNTPTVRGLAGGGSVSVLSVDY